MVAWISMRFKDNAPAGAEIKTYFYRSRGPGGQRKNRRETAVKIVHISTGIAVRATEHRTQSQNRELALERLEEKLANLRRVKKKRIPTRKPRSVRDAEIRKKKMRGEKKKARRRITDDYDN